MAKGRHYALVVGFGLLTSTACSTHGHGSNNGGEPAADSGGSGGDAGAGGGLGSGGSAGEGNEGSGGTHASGGSPATGGGGGVGGSSGVGGVGGAEAAGGSGGDAGSGGSGASSEGGGGGSATGGSGSGGTPGSGGTGGEGGEAGGSSEEECGCLDQAVTWGNYGAAIVSHRDFGSLSGCNSFRLLRHFVLFPQPDRVCESELSECSEAIGIPEVREALEDGDVQEALSTSPMEYGFHAPDAGYHRIQVGEATLEFGEPCGDREDCIDPPEGVTALRTLLTNLLEEQRQRESCASVLDQ